jgi:hypothetical protein
MYAFGKHPAFADFIDVAALPPVPPAFRHLHDVLRPALERDGGPGDPVLIAWCERGGSAVLWVHPSRDRGDGVTGAFRRCPLLLGMSAPGPLPPLLRFVGNRLATLAEAVMTDDAEAALARIAAAAAEWPAAFDGGAASAEPTGLAVAAAASVTAQGAAVVVAGHAGVVSEAVGLPSVSGADLAGSLRRVGARSAPVD